MKIEVFLKSNGADAKGIYDTDSNEIALKKGSVLVINLEATCPDNIRQNYRTAREQLDSGAIKRRKDGKLIVFKDIPKLSPSKAFVIATGKPGSGPKKWKTEDGQTVEELRVAHMASPPNKTREPRPPNSNDDAERARILQMVIQNIHDEQWWRHYRGRKLGKPITGWCDRLANFALINSKSPSLAQHLQWLKSLEERVVSFDSAKTKTLPIGVDLGLEILKWGGVERENDKKLRAVIGAVCKSARCGMQVDNAPMNSGWTKIAAVFSYYHATSPPQVIWDSRVSISLCSRIAEIATAEGIDRGRIQALFPCVGWIRPNGGGKRREAFRNRANQFFPNVYNRWSGHFAGGLAAVEISNILNRNRTVYGIPAQALSSDEFARLNHHDSAWFGNWTAWLVACVLFMDGE